MSVVKIQKLNVHELTKEITEQRSIFCVLHLFLLMNRSIHILFIKSKEERLNDIISQLEEC
jgi:hypothetical protein